MIEISIYKVIKLLLKFGQCLLAVSILIPTFCKLWKLKKIQTSIIVAVLGVEKVLVILFNNFVRLIYVICSFVIFIILILMRKATLSTAYIVVFITCLLIVGSSSLKLKTFSKAKAQAGNVSEISSRGMVTPGFRDQKGAGTKPTQMAYFREVINLASVFFNSNTKRRTEYISSQMWYQFRNKQIRFSVFVLNNPSNWDFSFVSQHTAWGSISPGVDAIFPNKSYMFAQQDWTGDHELIFIADQVQIGPNMTHGLTNAIENIIRLSQRQHQTCNCVRMANHIRELVNQYQSSNRWNVFCTSELNLYSRAAVRNKKYMFTKQKCYYLLYQN